MADMAGPGRNAAAWIRLTTWARANLSPLCRFCGESIDLTLPARHPKSWSLDHIRPLSEGGDPHDPANVAPAHFGCNSSAGAKLGNAKRGDTGGQGRTSRKW